jgi:hypothetical protein
LVKGEIELTGNFKQKAVVLVAILLFIALLMALVKHISNKQQASSRMTANPSIFIVGDNQLLAKPSGQEKPIMLKDKIFSSEVEDGMRRLFSNMDLMLAQSVDGTRLFYYDPDDPSDGFSLHYINLSNGQKDRILADMVMPTSGIGSSMDGSHVIYLKVDDRDPWENTLVLSNLTGERELDDHVTVFVFVEELDIVYYYKPENPGDTSKQSLYYIDLRKPSKSIKVDSNVFTVEYVDTEHATIYYSTENNEDIAKPKSLYKLQFGAKAEEVVDSFDLLINDEVVNGSFYYELDDQQSEEYKKDLYLFAEGRSTLVAKNYDEVLFQDIPHQVSVYTKKPEEEAGENTSEAEEDRRDTYMKIGNGEEMKFSNNPETRLYDLNLSTDGKLLYAVEDIGELEQLVSYDLLVGKMSNRKILEEGFSISHVVYDAEQSTLYYTKEDGNYHESMFKLHDGTKQLIANDYNNAKIYPDANIVMYTTQSPDVDSDDNNKTLYMYKDGQTTALATGDLDSFYVTEQLDVYYKDTSGNLYQYFTDKPAVLIASHVQAIYPTKSWL